MGLYSTNSVRCPKCDKGVPVRSRREAMRWAKQHGRECDPAAKNEKYIEHLIEERLAAYWANH